MATSQRTVETPDSETLHRLAVEASKFLALDTGDDLPTEEIVEQGKAVGHNRSEIRSLLQQESYDSAQSIPVPPQGNVLGELWRAHRTPQASFSPEVQKFREWMAERQENRCTEYDDGTHQHPVEHAYSLYKARKRTSRGKDIDRHFIKEHEEFTTVVITYCADKKPSETIAEHASKFYPADLSKERWNVLNRKMDTEQSAGCRMLAPEKPANSTPTPVFTHAHSVYWLEGRHSVEDFASLRDTFLSEVDGATAELNPIKDMIQVEHHTSAEIEPHDSVRRSDLDEERGLTTGASGEEAANLPLLRARNALRKQDTSAEEWAASDARDCPDWVEVWAAHLCCGADGNPRTNGVSRWGTFGNFSEIADKMREAREGESVKTGSGVPDDEQQSDSLDTSLSDTESEFVEAYLESPAAPERDLIESNIERNISELGGIARTDALVEAIQRRCRAAE